MKQIKGIGGIFFQSEDPDNLKQWYATHLGINGIFYWNDVATSSPCYTTWNALPKSSEIFKDTDKQYVFNYCVDDLDHLLLELKREGISNIGNIDKNEHGRFGYIVDPEGNKIVLWEPGGKVPVGHNPNPDRVTGLGGVFFKAENPKELNDWYAKHLGLPITEWGCSFEWSDPNNPGAKAPASTAWSTFKSDTTHFDPSKKQFMFNYRVKDLVGLMDSLEKQGIEVAGKMEDASYGKFGWIVDPEGNKVELWEPVDDGF
jgi:predicted enzyme related to lactoylglutathione lyase